MIEKLKKQNTWGECLEKLNEVIDAVNRHKDILRQIGEWGSRKGECLWCENITKVNIDSDWYDEHPHAENVRPPYMQNKRLRKALDVAVEGLEKMTWGCDSSDAEHLLKQIKLITTLTEGNDNE